MPAPTTPAIPSPARDESEAQRPIRVLVVDDQEIIREGMHVVLHEYPDLDVVATVGSGEEAIAACDRLHPDVVVTDLLMPGMGGIDLIASLHARTPEIRVVALSGFRDEELIERALQAGALGFLLKDVAIDELAGAVRAAAQGLPTLAPAATQALLHVVANRAQTRQLGHDLTAQERLVLALLAAGLSNHAIAARLVVTPATVKFHLRGIRAKLGTTSRTETVVLALRHHLVPDA